MLASLSKKSRFSARQLPTSHTRAETGRAITMKTFPPKELQRNWGEANNTRLTLNNRFEGGLSQKASGRPRTFEAVTPLPD